MQCQNKLECPKHFFPASIILRARQVLPFQIRLLALFAKIINLLRTNILAYSAAPSVTKKRGYMTLTLGGNVESFPLSLTSIK